MHTQRHGMRALNALRRSPVRLALSALLTLLVLTVVFGGLAGSIAPRARAATATTASFTTVADTRFEEAHPTIAYGSQRRLGTDGATGARIESALRFEVRGISGTVTHATLRLYIVGGRTQNGPAAYPAADAWSETSTWTTRPAAVGPAVATMGATRASGWTELDVTPLVAGNGTVNVLLKQTSADDISFYARERPGYGPTLVVTSEPPPPAPDTTPPSTPGNLRVTAAAPTSLTLNWNPSSDDTGVRGYDVYRGGVKVDSTTATTYAFTGLTCGTSYTLGVEAYDAAGNHSARASVSASTSACPSAGGPQIKYRFAYSNRADQDLMPQYGYNLIDVNTKDEADAVPAGTQAQVWLFDYDNKTCAWEKSDAYIRDVVSSMADDPKVAGFYFSNEPDPFACPNAPQQHKQRNALIHSLAPNKYTLIGIDANWRDHFDRYGSMWVGTADYVNYNPYVCFEWDTSTCDYAWLDHVLQTAQSLPQPYFIALQAFREKGEWRWPTPSEEAQMLNRLKDPSLTGLRGYLTFSWNWQNDPLLNHPDVLEVIKNFNLSVASGGGDNTPPAAPTRLNVTSTTATSISVSWSAASDNVGVTGYDVLRDGNKIGTTADTSYTFSGLACGTSYTVGVAAYDAAGNRSPQTSVVGATAACGNTPGPTPSDPVITAAGDICSTATDCAGTAALIDSVGPTRVLPLGDNAYQDGTSSEYADYYNPNWGRFKAKTSPTPGNHEYHTSGAAGYFAYFGSQAPAAYYSYEIGAWHLISLNGDIDHSAGSAQETWLKNDLAAHPAKCTLAYWHEPRFSSGAQHGSDASFDSFWRDLYAAGADVVLNGHDHEYERFAPQSPSGAADPNGIREFVVGTGGASHYTFATPIANSEVRDNTSFGVLKLTLHSTSYDWQFLPVAGATFTDSGTTACH